MKYSSLRAKPGPETQFGEEKKSHQAFNSGVNNALFGNEFILTESQPASQGPANLSCQLQDLWFL